MKTSFVVEHSSCGDRIKHLLDRCGRTRWRIAQRGARLGHREERVKKSLKQGLPRRRLSRWQKPIGQSLDRAEAILQADRARASSRGGKRTHCIPDPHREGTRTSTGDFPRNTRDILRLRTCEKPPRLWVQRVFMQTTGVPNGATVPSWHEPHLAHR